MFAGRPTPADPDETGEDGAVPKGVIALKAQSALLGRLASLFGVR